MRQVLVVLILLVFATFVRAARLNIPSQMVFDEIYYAKAARQYLDHQQITEETTHPPLSKLIIAVGIKLFGDEAVGWRAMGVVAGVLLVLAIYLLAWEVTRSPFISFFSAMLLALDGLPYVESRIAKPDIFLVLFLLGCYVAFWRYLRHGRVSWLYLSGVAAGMAVSTKWLGVVPLGTIPLYMVFLRKEGWIVPRRHWPHVVLAYGAIPLAVYLATWIPYFALGHSFRDLLQFHVSMFQFHAELRAGHPYQSAWWSWPLLLRPIWYQFEGLRQGFVRGIVAIGNPAVWWVSIPALLYLAWVVFVLRQRDAATTFVLVGFLASYLPYVFISRPLFLYHMLPALPFMILAVGITAARVRAHLGAAIPFLYLVLVLAWFVAYYPLLSALPISAARFYRLMWFGTWI